MRRYLTAAIALLASVSLALGQGAGILPSGTYWGNPSNTASPATPTPGIKVIPGLHGDCTTDDSAAINTAIAQASKNDILALANPTGNASYVWSVTAPTAVTFSSGTSNINWPGNSLFVNQLITFTTTGSFPTGTATDTPSFTGITLNAVYFVLSVSGSTVTISNKWQGAPIIFTSAGSGNTGYQSATFSTPSPNFAFNQPVNLTGSSLPAPNATGSYFLIWSQNGSNVGFFVMATVTNSGGVPIPWTASGAGNLVLVPCYAIASTIVIGNGSSSASSTQAQNLRLIGWGAGGNNYSGDPHAKAVRLRWIGSTTGPMLQNNGPNQVTVENLMFDGNYYISGLNGIVNTALYNSHFNNVSVINTYGTAWRETTYGTLPSGVTQPACHNIFENVVISTTGTGTGTGLDIGASTYGASDNCQYTFIEPQFSSDSTQQSLILRFVDIFTFLGGTVGNVTVSPPTGASATVSFPQNVIFYNTAVSGKVTTPNNCSVWNPQQNPNNPGPEPRTVGLQFIGAPQNYAGYGIPSDSCGGISIPRYIVGGGGLTLYASPSGTGTCFTSASPCTPQTAYNLLTTNFDLGAQNVVIDLACGTYTSQVWLSQAWMGGGSVAFLGSNSSSTPISGFAATNFSASNSTVIGTTLTIGTLNSGTIVAGQTITGALPGTVIVSGSGSTWTVSPGGQTTSTGTTITGTVATVTTSSPHGLANNQVVSIAGVAPSTYNGTFVANSVTGALPASSFQIIGLDIRNWPGVSSYTGATVGTQCSIFQTTSSSPLGNFTFSVPVPGTVYIDNLVLSSTVYNWGLAILAPVEVVYNNINFGFLQGGAIFVNAPGAFAYSLTNQTISGYEANHWYATTFGTINMQNAALSLQNNYANGAGSTTNNSNVLAVSSVNSGAYSPGQNISGTNIPAGTFIVSQSSGPVGGAGNYVMSANATGTGTISSPNLVGSSPGFSIFAESSFGMILAAGDQFPGFNSAVGAVGPSGAASGYRFLANANGIIQTSNAISCNPPNNSVYFPGTIVGVCSQQGQGL